MKSLLLLHGALGSSGQLAALKDELSPCFDVHVPGFPGHGGTPFGAEFSIPAFAEHVQQYCRHHNLSSVSIFGYSMGGYVALYLARRQPQLVERIATLATKFHWDEATAAREVKMLQPAVIEQKVPQFARTLQQRHAPTDWKEVLHQTAALMTGLGAQKALTPGDWAALTTPTLLMLGDRDKMVTLQETVAVYQQLPTAQLAVLPNTPHPIESVRTETLAFLVRQHLQ